MKNIYELEFNDLQGNTFSMGKFEGQSLLVVNTASQCGFTPQYKGLQKLHDEFSSQGFSVIGFPCNQFGAQEPGTSQEITEFCDSQFGVSFPMHEKVKVNGPQAHPLFEKLKKDAPGLLGTRKIKWNFTKFLIDNRGQTVKRFGPKTKPARIAEHIRSLLT